MCTARGPLRAMASGEILFYLGNLCILLSNHRVLYVTFDYMVQTLARLLIFSVLDTKETLADE